MRLRRGLQGLRGERGERGSTGERGAERGRQGIQGEKGKRGPRTHLPRNVTLSFWAVVLMAFIVTSALGYQQRQTRKLARENTASIVRLDDTNRRLARLEREANIRRSIRVRQTAVSDLLICRQVEALKKVQYDDAKRRLALAKGFKVVPGGEITAELLAKSVRNLRRNLSELRPRRCRELPSQHPPKLKKP